MWYLSGRSVREMEMRQGCGRDTDLDLGVDHGEDLAILRRDVGMMV